MYMYIESKPEPLDPTVLLFTHICEYTVHVLALAVAFINLYTCVYTCHEFIRVNLYKLLMCTLYM